MTLFLLATSLFAGDCELCLRDRITGAITRDSKQVRAFRKANPCPATGKTTGACKGYVVDHVVPLACADDVAALLARGQTSKARSIQLVQKTLDRPDNMQWQEHPASKSKDKWERDRCRELWFNPTYWPDASGETK